MEHRITHVMVVEVLFRDCRSPNNQSIVGEYSIQYHTFIRAGEYARYCQIFKACRFC